MSTTTAIPVVGQVVDVDPATLVIGANVRVDTHPDAKEFAASIKARGVLEVITAHADEDGALVVQRGQRRTIVAAEVGTPSGTVPVRVVEPPEEADRIVDQLTENLHRARMRESEVRDGVEQLALLGVSAAQIAKRTAVKRETVNAALTVTGSESTRERMDAQGLTLHQAATLAEFEDDEEAVGQLERAIGWGSSIEHVAQRLRDERAEREALLAEVERLRAEGVPVVDPSETPDPLHRHRLDSLVTADGQDVTPEQRDDLPGIAVVLTRSWEWPENDEQEDEEADAVRVWEQTWVCTDPQAAGLVYRYDATGRSPGHVEDEQQAEAAREERRRVRENNSAWRSAETVRREWLAAFVARKTAPKGAEAIICEAVLTAPHSLTKAMSSRHQMLRKVASPTTEGGDYYGDAAAQALATQPTTPKAQTMRTLAAVLLAWEENTDVHTWRNPGPWDRRIMAALITWGYEPSEVEQLLTSHDNADESDEAA